MKAIYATLSLISIMVLFYFFRAYGRENYYDHSLLRKTFEKEYEAWKIHCERVGYSSDISDRLKSQHFKNIVAMGPKVIPYLIEKRVNDPNFSWIGWSWLYVSRVNTDPKINPWAKEKILDWWQGGRNKARERAESLYTKWKDNKSKKQPDEARNHLDSIRALGIAALPIIIEKTKKGDTEFIEILSELTDNKVKKDATAAECLKWWNENKEDWLIPFPNKQPKANAGKDQIAAAGDVVKLDASDSNDPDRDSLEFSWRQTAGPNVNLDDPNNAKPKFTAPVVDKQTVLTFQLIVNDGSPKKSVHPDCESGQSEPALVNITIKPEE